ncbi:MAG: sigma-70 family RNA polymerase sigma factor [Myxococcota bacterium]
MAMTREGETGASTWEARPDSGTPAPGAPSSRRGAKVLRPAAFQRDDAALVAAVRSGAVGAQRTLYERHARHVERVLLRLLGDARLVPDALHDVFIEVFRDLDKLREPAALKAWMTRVAVFVARGHIRRRRRRRWLRFVAPETLPAREAPVADTDVTEALRHVYALLDTLPPDERIAFALRIVEGMDLKEVAAACDCSLATVKRRIKRAETAFLAAAAKDDSLAPWLKGGSRWTTT